MEKGLSLLSKLKGLAQELRRERNTGAALLALPKLRGRREEKERVFHPNLTREKRRAT